MKLPCPATLGLVNVTKSMEGEVVFVVLQAYTASWMDTGSEAGCSFVLLLCGSFSLEDQLVEIELSLSDTMNDFLCSPRRPCCDECTKVSILTQCSASTQIWHFSQWLMLLAFDMI